MKYLSTLIWHKLGSIHLTIVISLLLAVDLSFGYICLKQHVTLFSPLNETGLFEWSKTYGYNNLGLTFWFFALLLFLALLCLNTFICTTDRVVALLGSRRHFAPRQLFFRFAPHVMHYALIITLAGYLCSYLFSEVTAVRTLTPGTSMTLPGTEATVTLKEFEPVYYEGERLESFKNRVIYPQALLRLNCGSTDRSVLLAYNSPVRFKGYGIFLKNFTPSTKGGGMNPQRRIDITIRKDPGVYIYLAGILLFTSGLFMYMGEYIFFHKS